MGEQNADSGALVRWARGWFVTLRQPRAVKGALREPFDPADYHEVGRPAQIDGSA